MPCSRSTTSPRHRTASSLPSSSNTTPDCPSYIVGPPAGVIHVVARHHGDHPDPEVEDAAHLGDRDVPRGLEHAKQRRPRPRAGGDHRFTPLGQHPHQVTRDPTARDVRKRMDARQHGPHRLPVTAVHREEHVGHAAVRIRERIVHAQVQPVEHDVARQRVAVGVQSARGIADEGIARLHLVAVQRGPFLHDADDRAGEIVVPRGVEIGQLGGLAARQRHLVRHAPAADPLHHRLRHVRDATP